MLVDPALKCPCESARKAGECCFLSDPPVVHTGSRIQGADLQAELLTAEGVRLPTPRGWQFQAELNQPYQLDPEIEAIHDALLKLIPVPHDMEPGEVASYLTTRGQPIGSFVHSLYGTRYHQRQFLWRLGHVLAEEHFAYTPSAGNVEVVIHDRPLQIEFEAFLLRVMSSLDSLCLALSDLLEKKPREYTRFLEFLDTDESLPTCVRDKLRAEFNSPRDWLDQLRRLRNLVAHHGGVPGFRGVAHVGLLVRDAEVAGVRAGAFVVRTWRELRELTRAAEATMHGAVT